MCRHFKKQTKRQSKFYRNYYEMHEIDVFAGSLL